ncbi:MAG: hypothetical protein KAH05_04525 [Clostridiales bacterium]|nr:hypothetical protein [Clostridiales bacterium]
MATKIIDEILQLKVKLLNFLSDESLKEDMEKAYKKYVSDKQISEAHGDKGFNDWIIHDYRFQDKYELIDLYKENSHVDENLYKSFRNSKISFFTVVKTENNFILKDLFDKTDYVIGNIELLDETGIIFARIYPYNNNYYFVDEMTIFNGSFKEYLLKGIMSKFAEAKNSIGYLEINEFIRNNSILLYIFSNIIDDTIGIESEEESYDIHEAVYAVKDRIKVDEVLRNSEKIMILALEEGIYQIVEDKLTLGEIVDLKNKLEIDFRGIDALNEGKELINKIFGDSLVHLSDKIITIDDLL